MGKPQVETGKNRNQERLVGRAARVSLVASILILVVKFWAFHLTHSEAILSDALESIANVVAAALALLVLAIADKPADRDHPYGHGKVEFFSAAFEGGLIFFAAIMIIVAAIQTFGRSDPIQDLGWGLALIIASGLINALLGYYLLRSGKRHHSEALKASGQHVLSDFWTTFGVVVGLALVHATGYVWLDSATALIVGLSLAWTGVKLVRRSAGGLLDEEDLETLKVLSEIVSQQRPSGFIQVHHVRIMRSGSFHHIDAHVVVPEFWTVTEAHDRTDAYENWVMKEYPQHAELRLHVDPCRQKYCRACDVSPCPVRRAPFEKRIDISLEDLTSPEEPPQYRDRVVDRDRLTSS